MAKHIHGIIWNRGTWCIDLTNGPQGAAWNSWMSSYITRYNNAIVNRGAADSVSAVGLRFTSAHVEYNQGDRSFDGLKSAINYLRVNTGKPVYLIWADISFGNSLSKYPAAASWHNTNGWRYQWTGTQRTNLRVYHSAAKAWLLSVTADFIDWIRTGELAPGVNVVDWVYGLQLADETAPGNYNSDPQYSSSSYATAILEWYQTGRAAWPDGPLAGAVSWYPPGPQSTLRAYMDTNNMAMGCPDLNVYMTQVSTNRGVETVQPSGDLHDFNDYGTHGWTKWRYDIASRVPSVQAPQWYRNDMTGDWADATSKSIPGAKTVAEANSVSAARGGHPSGNNQHPWPQDDLVNWTGYTNCSALVVYEWGALAAELATAIIAIAPNLPYGANPYVDGGSSPTLETAPYGVNCGGPETTINSIDFVSPAAPGTMGTKVVTATIAGTDHQELFSGMWRYFGTTTSGEIVIPFTNGTYDIIFGTAETYWDTGVESSPDGIERAFDIRIQGNLSIDDWSPFEDAGGKDIANQRRINGVVVSDETLTISFERGPEDASYPDGKPEIAFFVVLDNGDPDPGFVAAAITNRPITPTSLALVSSTDTSATISFDEITLVP